MEDTKIVDLVIARLKQDDLWFTTKADPTWEEPADYYKLDEYGNLEQTSIKKIAKEVTDLIGEGAVDIDDAVEVWLQDAMVDYKIAYKDSLVTKFKDKPVVDGIEAFENPVQLSESKKVESKEDVVKALKDLNVSTFEELRDEIERMLEEEIINEEYEDFLDIISEQEDACEDYIRRRSDVTNTDWKDELGIESDYVLSAIQDMIQSDILEEKKTVKKEAYSYNWRDDIEEVENTEANDDLVYSFAENLIETDPDYAEYDDPWEVISQIISIWKIEKRSRLYDYLIKWYGSEEEMQKHIRSFYETNNAIYFETGCGYSIFDADLLGGNADGTTADEFSRFVANGGKKEESKLVEEFTIETFNNKYKPLYDKSVEVDGDKVYADNITLRGSGISKRIEATLNGDELRIDNEEIGFNYDGNEIFNIGGQYWFESDMEDKGEFYNKVLKATDSLYKDMRKLQSEKTEKTEGIDKSKYPDVTGNIDEYHLSNDKNNPVWIKGYVGCGDKIYDVSAKVFMVGSEFGIDNGQVSKLWIQDRNAYKPMCNYDRGWDIEPQGEDKADYDAILKLVVDYRNANPYEVEEENVNFNNCTKDKKIESYKRRLKEENNKSANLISDMFQASDFDADSKQGQIVMRTSELFNALSDKGYDVQVSFDNGESTNAVLLGQQGGQVIITINNTDQPLRAFASGNFEITNDNMNVLKDIQEQITTL